ncbi:MAG: sigma-54-dependent Fis family transcriptional regulator [Planctomycetes bacterium]|nr:sigma-54-dependent Fis family transcriptional regulator [Planctomycetota bacterium]
MLKQMLIVAERVAKDSEALAELRGSGFECVVAAGGEEALRHLDASPFGIVVVDVTEPTSGGADLVNRVWERSPRADVIAIVPRGRRTAELDAVRLKTADFVTEPVDPGELADRARRIQGRRREAAEASGGGAPEGALPRDIVGASPEITELMRVVRRVATSTSTVLMTGESGTGKEVIAHAIHSLCERTRGGPFIPVNCAAIPDTLLESELFGYVHGSFTGARGDKKGLFELAHGGTLFLDEIGEMSVNLQAKLLRVIEEKAIRPLGGTQLVRIRSRLLCSTHRDLK